MVAIMVGGATVLGLALGMRYGLLEAGRLPVDCTANLGWACHFKTALLWSFLGNKLGWLALGSGVLAFVSGYRPLAWLGWLSGLLGLVLYCFDASAVGGLAALLALVREPKASPGGQQETAQPPGDGLGIGRLA
jgi:hypothetical protein